MENLLKNMLGIREAQIHLLETLIKVSKINGFICIEDLIKIKKDVIKTCRDSEMGEALNELKKEQDK